MTIGRWMVVGGLVFAFIALGLGLIIMGIGGNLGSVHFLRLCSVVIGASFLGAIAGAWTSSSVDRERQAKKDRTPDAPQPQGITLPTIA